MQGFKVWVDNSAEGPYVAFVVLIFLILSKYCLEIIVIIIKGNFDFLIKLFVYENPGKKIFWSIYHGELLSSLNGGLILSINPEPHPNLISSFSQTSKSRKSNTVVL